MLPTLGFFHSFDCPFYKGGAGQCSRPYCHYKHAKKDPDAPPEPTEDALGTLVGVSNLSENDSTNDVSSSEGHKSRTAMYKATVDAAPTYKPTPIAVLKSSHIPIPYTPSAPSRTPVVKKSKPKEEYVPHSIGGVRTYYPPYCPTSTSAVDQLRNPLYEIYGPEGAQFSPNDVEPIDTGYSYAPPKYASYAPNASSLPDKNEYVPMPVSRSPKHPQFSPPDSQQSDDDDNVDLAIETAAQTNGDGLKFGENILDLDLSEFDDLEFEYEDSEPENTVEESGSKGKGEDLDESSVSSPENSHPKKSESSSKPSSKSKHSSHTSPQSSGEKRRSSSSSSSDAKRHKSSHEASSHDDTKKNGQSEEKKLSSSKKSHSSKHSSSSSTKKSSSSSSKSGGSHKSSSKLSSSSSTKGHKKIHSSSSDSKSKTESPSSSCKSKSESTSSSSKSKPESSSSSSKSKTESSSSSKSKDKIKVKDSDKSKSKEKSKDKDSHRHKDRDKEKNKHKEKSKHREKSSHHSSESKIKYPQTFDEDKLEEEIRQMEAELDASLEDEDMIEQQCFAMFSEYSESLSQNPPASTSKNEDQRVAVNEEPVAAKSSKKRVAHQAPHSSYEPPTKPAAPLAKKCTPYQVMRDRWEMLKKKKEEAEAAHKASLAIAPQNVPRAAPPVPYSSTNNTAATLPGSTLSKKKIASVPNVAMLLKPPKAQYGAKSSSDVNKGTPPSRFYNQEKQRVDEYGRLVKVRVAHTPNMEAPVMKKPIVNPSDCRKFKVPTRQANVNKLYQAYVDAGFGEQSHDMALESERASTQGTESLGVYSHRIIQILKDLRACAESSQNGPKLDGLSGVPNRVVSHHAMLAGKLGSKVSWSIQSNKKAETKVSSQSVYEKLEPYIMSKELMDENGFPMPSNEKGVANIKPSKYRTIQQPADPLQRICVRCLKPYSVNKHGIQEKDEECFYHWGRKFTFRRFRDAETKYTCCDGTGGQGCSVASYHVHEPNNERNVGFMATLSKPWMESDPGVYALDCEMCYTTAGTELTRVTVIKEDLSVVYETLVKPPNKILDYNTRFSGITEEDLKGVKTTILQVQATLLGMFCDKTILIGHSLDSDLKALKLIHPTVVDTSIVFPHKMGPPQKRALRTLAADYLKKIIQNGVGGHDSKEDAVAAMELMLWKIKEDEKMR